MIPIDRGEGVPLTRDRRFPKMGRMHLPTRRNIQSLGSNKIMGNMFKTAFLLTAMTLLLLLIGRAFGGQNGMIIALVVAVVMNFSAYFFSDKIALATYRAQPVTREQLPRAYAAVERLTQKIGIPMPKMYVIPTESPNAFATGRNPQHASVAVTHGILRFTD